MTVPILRGSIFNTMPVCWRTGGILLAAVPMRINVTWRLTKRSGTVNYQNAISAALKVASFNYLGATISNQNYLWALKRKRK